MEVKDQLGRSLTFQSTPRRIVSVVPSQTEFLSYLGLDDEVVGISKFCIHPDEWFRNKSRVGGTKSLDLAKISELEPDLIIANKEENEQHQIEELAKTMPVWVSDINNLEDALEMMLTLTQVLERGEKFPAMVETVDKLLAGNSLNCGRCAYLIWNDPFMGVGSNTFIHSMIQAAGFQNVLENRSRYPELSIEDIASLDLDFLFLSTEPFPFNANHQSKLAELLPNVKVEIVDGEIFSWYGSRLLQAEDYFAQLRTRLSC